MRTEDAAPVPPMQAVGGHRMVDLTLLLAEVHVAGLSAGELVETLRSRFTDVLHDHILSGRFAADWTAAGADAEKAIQTLRDTAEDHPLLRAEHAVRERRPPATGDGEE